MSDAGSSAERGVSASSLPGLVADIGGTNARFALVGADAQPFAERVLRCSEHADIVTAVETYLAGVDGPRPREAVFAIANPITGDRLTMTNHTWSFSIEQTRRRLQLERFDVINDFTALAMSLPWLEATDLRQVGRGEAVAGSPMAVLGPGTGLGVSGLLPAGERWIPLQGEGGHASVCPGTRTEHAIVEFCSHRFGHVSFERLVSGSGLQNLLAALSALEDCPSEALSPETITERALSGTDPLCARVVDTFCALLGAAAGNLALTLGATGGVYIGGGIVPRLGERFHRSPFRARFQDKGRFSTYLAPIPTFVIHAARPALIGVAKALRGSGRA